MVVMAIKVLLGAVEAHGVLTVAFSKSSHAGRGPDTSTGISEIGAGDNTGTGGSVTLPSPAMTEVLLEETSSEVGVGGLVGIEGTPPAVMWCCCSTLVSL